MKKTTVILLFSTLLSFSFITKAKPIIELKTLSFKVCIDDKGFITNLIDVKTGADYMLKNSCAPVMSIRLNHKVVFPNYASLIGDILTLKFDEGILARIKVGQEKSYLSFEVLSLENDAMVDLIIWGPYPTSLNKVIGETVGVVQGEDYAMGLQALNPKTLGGYPWNENDCMPQIDILEQNNFADLSEEGKRYVLYRVEAAKPVDKGSTLQAYCRKRNTDRIIENMDHDYYVAPAYNDGGYIGSKIALFGCHWDKALETIGEIEIAEGLPHPYIDGKWGKIAPTASAAYLILDFGEKDFMKAIEITKKAGLKHLYHSDPFENWGHFELNEKQFPNGIAGMKHCVDIAKENGIALGVHVLSNFISTEDAYVSPIPDKRLAIVGSGFITEEINETQTEIAIDSPVYFNQNKNNTLKTVRIDDELIRYGKVSENKPWKLLECERGEFKTKISFHKKGSEINKLADHGYKVFLTNAELGKEVAENVAAFYNKTGLRQISFDGLEGNRSTGMGNYGEILFTKAWYDKLNDDIKTNYIADASRTSHYFWHIYSRMNWGEPWYAGFRESQTDYRFKYQKYFKRNLMPCMLGWFLMKPETSVEDIEWMLAKSAAYKAGYAFVSNYETIDKNGNSEKIFQLIGEWEELRLGGMFSSEQRKRMEDINNEFMLLKQNNKKWNLYQVFSAKFKHLKKDKDAGDSLFSILNFDNKGEEQTMNFILSAVDGDISNITFGIDKHKPIVLPVSIKAGETIKFQRDKRAFVYDKNWQIINEFELDQEMFKISNGNHQIHFDCKFANINKEGLVKIELRTFAKAEEIVKQ